MMIPKITEHSKLNLLISGLDNFKNIEIRIDEDKEKEFTIVGNSQLDNCFTAGEYNVNLRFISHDGLYRASAILIAEQNGIDNNYYLKKPIKWSRVQQREFYRLGIENEIEVCVKKQNRWIKYVTEDISGSGLLIRGEESISNDEEMVLKSDLFDKIGISRYVTAKVKRSFTKDDSVYLGVQFIPSIKQNSLVANFNLNQPEMIECYSNRMADKISGFVLREQLKSGRKNLE